MRLIRSVTRPAYISSSHQLQELKTSNETLNHVLPRMDHGSSLQCVRWRSFKAVSVPSDETADRRKSRKRIPRNERKSMVEKYVNTYREMNAGKFPTASDTNKSVGGSYYVIKDILEELKYGSKMLSSVKMDTTSPPNNAESMSISQTTNDEGPSNVQKNNGILMRIELKRDKSLSKSEGTLSTQVIVDGAISKDAHNESISITQTTNDEVPSNVQQNSEVLAIKELKSGDSLTKGEWILSTTQVVVDGTTSKAQTLDSISESPQSDKEQQSSNLVEVKDEAKLPVIDVSKDAETQSRQFDGQQPIGRQQQSVDSDDTSERELDKVPAENTPEKKSSIWQNLKSLTNGFFDMWRR